MKKIVFLSISLLLLNACATTKNLQQEKYVFIEGSDLYYEVNSEDEKYSFDLNLNEFSAELISFDWDMEGLRSGTIAMTEKALTDAMGLKNNFSGGYNLLTDKTSVWLSTKLFDDLKSGNEIEIDLGNGQKDKFQMSSNEMFSIINKSHDQRDKPINLPVFVVANKLGDKEIWILDDPENRLIVKMDIGFQIELMEWRIVD